MEAATLTDISAIAHEIGGAIGFYTFVEEGRRILEISRELGAQSVLTDSDFNKAQTEIMTLLHSALSRIENEEI